MCASHVIRRSSRWTLIDSIMEGVGAKEECSVEENVAQSEDSFQR